MGRVDLTNLYKAVNDYSECYADLLRKYESGWNDPVHESYSQYNAQMKSFCDELDQVLCSTKKINDSLDGYNQLVERAESLINEVDSL